MNLLPFNANISKFVKYQKITKYIKRTQLFIGEFAEQNKLKRKITIKFKR